MQDLQKLNLVIPLLYLASIIINLALGLQLYKMKEKIKNEIKDDYKDVIRQRELDIQIKNLEKLIDIKTRA